MLYVLRETDDYDMGGDSDEDGDYHKERREAAREKRDRSSIIMSEFKKRKGAQVILIGNVNFCFHNSCTLFSHKTWTYGKMLWTFRVVCK